MQKQGVIWPSILNKPVHGLQDVLSRWDAHGMLRIIGQKDHVLSAVSMVLDEVVGQVLGIIDATSQLSLLTKVVDADE